MRRFVATRTSRTASVWPFDVSRLPCSDAFQTLFADLAVQGRAADAEAAGDLGHVAGVDLDGVLDQVALDLLQRAQMAALVEDLIG